MKNKIMDECFGKQIDFYNQLPTSVETMENILKRLDESESKSKIYKLEFFGSLRDCSIDCGVDFMVLYSDGTPSASLSLNGGYVSFKIDHENEKIILDIYQTIDNYGKKCQPIKILPTPAIIDINDNLNYIRQSDTHGGFYISFKNRADWEKRRRREIEEIRIPIHEAMDDIGFLPIINFLNILDTD
jgi:hypothetical protein